MTQYVDKTASVETGLRLESYRKALATLRRAIPKGEDPVINVKDGSDNYHKLLVARWSEWV